MVTKKIYDVDIWSNDEVYDETDVQITSICADNTTHLFTMAPAKPGGTPPKTAAATGKAGGAPPSKDQLLNTLQQLEAGDPAGGQDTQ